MKAGIVIETLSADETLALGFCAGKVADPGLVVCLRGELGSGKTVFVRGLTRGHLGDMGVPVTSPTYVLQHVYRGGEKRVHHLDIYRLTGGPADFEGAGLRECLSDTDALVCIEWPERVLEILPQDRMDVELEHDGPERRIVHLHATGPVTGRLIDEIARQAGSRDRLRAYMESGLH